MSQFVPQIRLATIPMTPITASTITEYIQPGEGISGDPIAK